MKETESKLLTPGVFSRAERHSLNNVAQRNFTEENRSIRPENAFLLTPKLKTVNLHNDLFPLIAVMACLFEFPLVLYLRVFVD